MPVSTTKSKKICTNPENVTASSSLQSKILEGERVAVIQSRVPIWTVVEMILDVDPASC
jgi:hypothetical protein